MEIKGDHTFEKEESQIRTERWRRRHGARGRGEARPRRRQRRRAHGDLGARAYT